MRIFLCGHTGSKNRGCDAILKSTYKVLNVQSENEIDVLTFDKDYDEKMGLGENMKLISYPPKNIVIKIISYFKRKIFHDGVWVNKRMYVDLFKNIQPNDLILNVGGDTYCYDTPYLSYALNITAKEKRNKTIFWGCSIDERILSNKEMQEDVNKYSYIVTRESLSYDIFLRTVNDKSKIFLACDPAFQLDPESVEVPNNMIKGNTLGLNISPLLFRNCEDENDMMYQNIEVLISYVLANTDMAICLIPHVYTLKNDNQDLYILRKIYEKYKFNKRVSSINKEYTSSQLKYIISQCRFFIGARTHSMIAAYSSNVPALALSYSIKSLGIAKDIFGTYEGYAISKNEFTNSNVLLNKFISTLIDGEDLIKERYKAIMPEYKNSILKVTKQILQEIGENNE
ncbi:polysaccharide pyruvyl transferase family protein [Floccifex sp.]|uniref:polysaccharide pyruvyl transferase family protein n=1 Tax=Floccifex sp. TaxID=2815810 RepID=UPI002A7664C7|nr:polysaccharide pyruvyl transferase family protein [Floccifex sp.]MDY2957685.1 polysaccharide pyruvyl transferase family protein [Floccifex sp.]